MNKNYSLQSLPPEERPRERLKQLGAENLSLQELLAIIIEKWGINNSMQGLALHRHKCSKSLFRKNFSPLQKGESLGAHVLLF
jgi:DNA repair protein RadC